MSDMIIGLTGGIGSGKSAAAQRFASHGVAVIDADQAARDVVAPGQPALATIAEHFGTKILLPSGELDRAQLRQLIFNTPEHKQWLEALLHPLIRQRITAFLQAATSPYALLETPLLIETDQRQLVDKIIVVDVPEATQIARTMGRDDNSAEMVQAIMASQASRDQRRQAADYLLDNSAELTDLYQQVDVLHTMLLARLAC